MQKKLTINIDEELYNKLNAFIGDNSSLSEFVETLINSHLSLHGAAIEKEFREYL